MLKLKILIIFPTPPSTNDASHYPYWHRIFKEASKSLDTQYIYETQSHPLLRIFTILSYISKGYKNVYIHYSYWSVILCRVIKLFMPLTIYYWDCEWYDQKPKNTLLDIALHWCDVLVTGSQSIANQYIKIFNLTQPYTLNPKPFRVVPNWSEYIPVKKINLPKDQIHILFVHHLSPRKGSRELPTIIRETIKTIPNAHFHIIGDGPDFEWLTRQNLPNTTLYGNLPLSEVCRYFASCDIFIMPSRSEGFPRVILEAMNYGLPIITTDVGNVRELLGQTNQQFVVKKENALQFSNKLTQLVNTSKEQKAKLINENIDKAKEYSFVNSVEKFINQYI